MSYYDVLKSWGPPIEKEERESKREHVWMYEDARVVFQEGKVSSWHSNHPRLVAPHIDFRRASENSANRGAKDVALKQGGGAPDTVVEEILKDILEDPLDDSAAPDRTNNKVGVARIIR